MDKTRFVYVDALRGIAASMVVLYHAVEGQHVDALVGTFPTWTQALLRHGDFGVAIFFVLSGFVIAHTLRAPLSPGGALRFMAKRSIRLDPPYWAAIAITILFSALASSVVIDRARDSVTIPQFISHLFYLQGILAINRSIPSSGRCASRSNSMRSMSCFGSRIPARSCTAPSLPA